MKGWQSVLASRRKGGGESRTNLETVHEGEELRNDSSLDLSVGLFEGKARTRSATSFEKQEEKQTYLVSLGSNRIDLIDEDDGRTVLLGLLERLPQVALTLSGHLGHDLWSVDEEEEGSGFVGDGSSHEGLSSSRRSEHEDTSGRLDSDGLEELRVTEGKLDELSDLSHLRTTKRGRETS